MVVVLFGPAYSVYVRAARIALEEKGVAYRLDEFDVFDEDEIPPDYLVRHPFKRVPAFEHDGFRLYETGAITRYVDETFPGPLLQPEALRERARMNQVIALLDAYAYWPLVRVIYVQRCDPPHAGAPDEDAIAAALPQAERCLDALEGLIGERSYLAGERFTLADAHAVPMFDYFLRTDEGRSLVAGRTGLSDWWSRIKQRPSVTATPFPEPAA